MTQLHEILAVEPDVKKQTQAIFAESSRVFHSKPDLFTGLVKTYEPVKEDGLQYAPETKEMATTVPEKLAYTEKSIVRLLDVIYQKEKANTQAKADIVVDGVTLAKDVPASTLLQLEKRFVEIRNLYLTLPTLDQNESWTSSDEQRSYTWKSSIEEREKTAREIHPVVLYEATKEHPAQVKEVSKDVRVGIWKTVKISGMITPKHKSDLLKRVETLAAAIKTARCRANNTKVEKVMIGQSLFDYIHSK